MNEYRLQEQLMGSAFELLIGYDNELDAHQLLQMGVSEIRRIAALLTEFDNSSVTSEINHHAGKGSIEVPIEVYELLKRCFKLSELTQGAFDITVAPLKGLYNFKRRKLKLPDQNRINETLKKTGFRNIHLGKNNSVYLTRKGMKISFASIGKGYAADCVRKIWVDKGVTSGVINASGDLSIIGHKADGTPWNVGIPDPENTKKMLLYIPLKEGSIATSGDYEQYFILNNTRYSHTLNPQTGLPLTGITSVTVTGRSAELCDALATAVSVMGVEVGLYFINQLPDIHCLIIDDRNQLHFSKNITFEETI